MRGTRLDSTRFRSQVGPCPSFYLEWNFKRPRARFDFDPKFFFVLSSGFLLVVHSIFLSFSMTTDDLLRRESRKLVGRARLFLPATCAGGCDL